MGTATDDRMLVAAASHVKAGLAALLAANAVVGPSSIRCWVSGWSGGGRFVEFP